METRLAGHDDAPQLAALHGECFGAARWSLAHLTSSLMLGTARPWMVCENGVLLGFILCQFVVDEGEILTFCVAPSARRRGIGRHLVETALAQARHDKIRLFFLEVAANNAAAIALYTSFGFTQMGKRVGYYHQDSGAVDALMLGLSIAEAKPAIKA